MHGIGTVDYLAEARFDFMGQHPSFVHLVIFLHPILMRGRGSLYLSLRCFHRGSVVRPDWKRHIDSKDHEYVALMLEIGGRPPMKQLWD